MNRKYFLSYFYLLVCLCQFVLRSSCERVCSQLVDVGNSIINSLSLDPGFEIYLYPTAVEAELIATSTMFGLRNKTEIIISKNGYLFVKFKPREV